MKFDEKYINTTENKVKEDKSKVLLSDDAYAIVEFIDLLIKKVEHLRLSLIK